METLAEKLHPSRFTDMSGKMAAMVAYILGETWTDPQIISLSITSDGYLLGRDTERGFDTGGRFLGCAADLYTNLRNLFEAAELTPAEVLEFVYDAVERVDNFSEEEVRE